MSDRLTERNANGTAKSRKSPKSSYMGTVYEEMAEIQTEILNRLCDLEDKIEQGKIVELPCAVGSEAYHLTSANTLDELGVAEIFNGKVCSFSKDEKGLWIFCRYDNGLTYWYKETDIGTMLFLDRAAAEAKLREMEGDNNE